MRTLLVGFDSAWTPNNRGALVGALHTGEATSPRSGSVQSLGPPQIANFPEATETILGWQGTHQPARTLILLDQPTIVRNATGCRPVDRVIASPISRRRGGVQPANTSKAEMFGVHAPVWPFLQRFGGAADPCGPLGDGTHVFETYPALSMVACGWSLTDSRPRGRLPKYNPVRRKTFRNDDWQYVCTKASGAYASRGLSEASQWLSGIADPTAAGKTRPHKHDQDGLDAYVCLLVALHMAEGGECSMIGDAATGYVVVPHCPKLHEELGERCAALSRDPAEVLRVFTAGIPASAARHRHSVVA